MNMTRREFGQRGFLALVVLSALNFVGCPIGSIWATIKAYLPTVISAVQKIIDMLAAVGVIPIGAGTAADALITTIQSLVAAALQAISEYENAPAADKATWLGKLREALASIADNITTFINALKLSGNPIVKIIGLLVGLIISTINGFLGQIPAAPASAKSVILHDSVRVGGAVVTVTPKKRDRKQFVSDWNTICVANNHPEAKLS